MMIARNCFIGMKFTNIYCKFAIQVPDLNSWDIEGQFRQENKQFLNQFIGVEESIMEHDNHLKQLDENFIFLIFFLKKNGYEVNLEPFFYGE